MVRNRQLAVVRARLRARLLAIAVLAHVVAGMAWVVMPTQALGGAGFQAVADKGEAWLARVAGLFLGFLLVPAWWRGGVVCHQARHRV